MEPGTYVNTTGDPILLPTGFNIENNVLADPLDQTLRWPTGWWIRRFGQRWEWCPDRAA